MPLHPLVKLVIERGSVLEDSWKGFIKLVLPDAKPGDIQYEEMRKAYYCGFYASFSLVTEISSEVPEDQAMHILSNIYENAEKEIRKFWETPKEILDIIKRFPKA
jgi:hypothetical protein